MPFIFHPTKKFSLKLERIRKNDPTGFARILKVIDRILHYPDEADGRMRGKHHSRYKKYVGRRDYRLIYEWCELCRKVNRNRENLCGECGTVRDHSVVFFDVYHKNEAAEI